MIVLTRDAPESLQQQLVSHFRALIATGELQPGSRLPASRALAHDLNISRLSVVNAYTALESAGLITGKSRRGIFVADRTATVYTQWPLNDGDFIASDSHSESNAPDFPAHINLSTGSLPAEFMPVEAMRHALNTVLDRDAGAALGYEPTEGFEPLRRAIANQLYSFGITVEAKQILVTGGCQQAIDLAVQALIPQNGVLLTTDPTYIGLIDIARTRHLQLVTVPWTEHGIDLNVLENIIVEHHPHLFYLMTTFHNPTGGVLPVAQRRKLLRLAEAYHLPILEDGVYDGLGYDGTPIPSLRALDQTGIVLYASGYSKTVVPGTRIGYLICTEQLYTRISQVKRAADVCTPGLNQRAMAELLQNGQLAAHLEKVRHACKYRRDALLNSLERFTNGQWRWIIPTGGLYVWVELPNTGPTAAELLLHANDLGVDFALGTSFSPTGAWPYHMRLNFTSSSPRILGEGVRRLWTAWSICPGWMPH